MALPLGPYPLPGQEPEPVPIRPVDIGLEEDIGIHGLRQDVDEVVGLLGPFNGRARRFLVALLRGGSKGMASMAAGVDIETIRGWEKKHPEFARAATRAANLGFTNTFERELYSRAMAGRDDRGSMRALELVVKARDSNYREKSQVQMEVQLRAQEAVNTLAGGWRDVIEAPSEGDNE